VGKYDHTFLLKMCRGVGGEDISNSIAAALKPRGCLEETIGEFQELLLEGLPNGATKGTCLAFGTATGKLSITVNDKYIGTIPSESLAQAFFKIYTDSNAVCDLKPVVGGTDGLQLLKKNIYGFLVGNFVVLLLDSYCSTGDCSAAVGVAVGFAIGVVLTCYAILISPPLFSAARVAKLVEPTIV
jgi:hypothetical protein